mgnify:CR=1 FL=1
MHKKVLITGGAGFVAHHTIDRILSTTDWSIVSLDRLDCSGNLNRISNLFEEKYGKDFHTDRFKFVYHDLKAEINTMIAREIGDINIILHLAAGSHVDRSILNPLEFVYDNVVGTCNILNFARTLDNLELFLNFSCYDKETRAFTKEGLKSCNELKVGDIVFTLNPETKKVEEQPIEKIIIQDYSGSMIKFDNKRIDLLVTPNHRMYQSDMSVLEANNCLTSPLTTFPFSTGFQGKTDISPNLMYLIGIFLGDGHIAYQERKIPSKSGLSKKERDIHPATRGPDGRYISTEKIGNNDFVEMKSWRIFLDIPENDKARQKTEEALTSLGISYTKQKGKSGEHLYFSSEEWTNFFSRFGKGAENKYIPKEFLDYDASLLIHLFDGLMDSDGYWKTKSFSTISDQLANNICELAIKIGYYPNKQRKVSESYFEGRKIQGESWAINFSESRKYISSKKISTVDYNDKIWCITVKNKNFLVERNGKFAFSGNTDEVFGPAPAGVNYKERDRYNSTNPYSATKAAAEELCVAFENTYNLPIIITHSMNIVGERQHPEKFVPMCIRRILNEEEIQIHANKECTQSGSRFYIHAKDVANALLFIINNKPSCPVDYGGAKIPKFNIVGSQELSNLELAQLISGTIGIPLKYKLIDFHSSRPGHDLRYALDGSLLKSYGWEPNDIKERLVEIVKWYLDNRSWL